MWSPGSRVLDQLAWTSIKTPSSCSSQKLPPETE
jgi:hypothetical protein